MSVLNTLRNRIQISKGRGKERIGRLEARIVLGAQAVIRS